MTHRGVADEVLGKFSRQQHDWFERVRKGSLDPEEIQRVVQQIIDSHVFSITLEGSHKASELVALGKYGWSDDWITDERFPIMEHAPETRTIELVKFKHDHDPTTEESLSELAHRGLERPTYEDAFYFGIQHPEEQRKHPIVFLHEPVQKRGSRFVLILGGRAGRRLLDLRWFDFRWERHCVSAGVRK